MAKRLLIAEIESCRLCHCNHSDDNDGCDIPFCSMSEEYDKEWWNWMKENQDSGIYPKCPLPEVTANP